jgi:hypothetical protein
MTRPPYSTFSAAAAAVAVCLAGAPAASAGEWRFGISAGAALSKLTISGLPAGEIDRRTGGAVAAIAAFRPSDRWSIEFRPGHAGGGARVVVSGAKAEIVANYFELPLLVTRDLGSSNARPYVFTGVALSSLTSAKAKLPTGSTDIQRDFADSDVSFRLGAGVRRAGSGVQPFVEFDYAWGTKDVNKERSGLGAEVGAIENRSAQIRAGFTFGRR